MALPFLGTDGDTLKLIRSQMGREVPEIPRSFTSGNALDDQSQGRETYCALSNLCKCEILKKTFIAVVVFLEAVAEAYIDGAQVWKFRPDRILGETE